jgi:hypothetical protein
MMFSTHNSGLSSNKASLLRLALKSLATALAMMLSGCGSSIHTPVSNANGPQLYMTPVIYDGTSGNSYAPATFSIDDGALTFAQKTYLFSTQQSGSQVNYSGNITSAGLSRGLTELELTYACGTSSNVGAGCPGITYDPPQVGWAVELADQSGGLAQLPGQSFVPLVPAVTCPSMSSPQTFLFVTLPARLAISGTGLSDWNPQLETAYGSVDISASGGTVTFANIKQNLLPSAGGGAPASAPSSSLTGVCSSTVFGNTVAVPANPTISTDPTGTTTISPQAIVGIGPSGLLVEDNGSADVNAPGGALYENLLGAGTGAIGLPESPSAVEESALVTALYLGFFYGSGSSGSTTNWSSSLASFGFPSLPSTCASVAPQTSTLLYGGDFAGNNPAAANVQSGGGFGNCDFAIDLGAPASTNGLFPAAKVYVGSSFATNTTGQSYSFPAVAIAGQLNGKFAIFVIGEDTVGSPNQAWGLYLLQSN